MLFQKTLSAAFSLEGIGLHTGRHCQIKLEPAAENTGVIFVGQGGGRTKASLEIPALWSSVVNTVLCTEIRNSHGAKVRTVEHLMAAIRACNLDNVRVYCTETEIPILDGSSLPFIKAIQSVGLKRQQAPRRVLKIRKPVRVEEGDKWVEILPYGGCRYGMEIEFENQAIGHQLMTFDLTFETFRRDIAPARTFGELKQAHGLHAAGLALGSGPSNTLIFDGDLVVSHEGKRYEDECIRHKILDAVGDLHMIGAPILAHFKGYKSGHKMHALLLEAVMRSDNHYSWVNASDDLLDDSFPMPTATIAGTVNATPKPPTDRGSTLAPQKEGFGEVINDPGALPST